MTTQRYEIEAWLGADHDLTGDQIDELVQVADDIAGRHPDDPDLREEELAATYRCMVGDLDVIDELADRLLRARLAESRAVAGLRRAAVVAVDSGAISEAGYARRAGVDRMTVRSWRGLR